MRKLWCTVKENNPQLFSRSLSYSSRPIEFKQANCSSFPISGFFKSLHFNTTLNIVANRLKAEVLFLCRYDINIKQFFACLIIMLVAFSASTYSAKRHSDPVMPVWIFTIALIKTIAITVTSRCMYFYYDLLGHFFQYKSYSTMPIRSFTMIILYHSVIVLWRHFK